MKLYLKHKRTYHIFDTYDGINEYMQENPASVLVEEPPKKAKVKRHTSSGGKIYFVGGSDEINAFHREGLQTDVWNLIVEGETKKQWEGRVKASGLPMKQSKLAFSKFKSNKWIEVI